jgi:hypothetical protein
MSSLRDRRDNEFSDRAFQAGKAFAKEHPFSEFKDDRDSNRLMDNCPFHLQRFADVFKYGCQSVWRRSGELPNMVAYDLEPGDIFTIEKPDPESPVRVCLTNDKEKGLRFGWPNNKDYWCSMGIAVPVKLVRKEKGDEDL